MSSSMLKGANSELFEVTEEQEVSMALEKVDVEKGN